MWDQPSLFSSTSVFPCLVVFIHTSQYFLDDKTAIIGQFEEFDSSCGFPALQRHAHFSFVQIILPNTLPIFTNHRGEKFGFHAFSEICSLQTVLCFSIQKVNACGSGIFLLNRSGLNCPSWRQGLRLAACAPFPALGHCPSERQLKDS